MEEEEVMNHETVDSVMQGGGVCFYSILVVSFWACSHC